MVTSEVGRPRREKRTLTDYEVRFCEELGIDKASFSGGPIFGDPLKKDSYELLAPRPLNSRATVVSQLEAIEIERNLRFGNHVISLTNALKAAVGLNISKVMIPPNPMLRRTFSIQGVRFWQTGARTVAENNFTRLRGRYFYQSTLRHLFQDKSPVELSLRFISKGLVGVPRLNIQELGQWMKIRVAGVRKNLKQDLTIHIRSGDVFSSSQPHSGYWQPPFDFYTSVIKSVMPRRVTLVFEDRGNPVIDKIEEYLAASRIEGVIRDGSIEEAFSEILTSRTLIVARGTFAKSIVASSKNLRNLYTFGGSQNYELVAGTERPKFTVHVLPDLERAYESKVSPWENTEEQRSAMLTHEIGGIELSS
jgi:hypothetical protein